jgi:hypothetical protein
MTWQYFLDRVAWHFYCECILKVDCLFNFQKGHKNVEDTNCISISICCMNLFFKVHNNIVHSFKFILKVGVENSINCERTIRITDHGSAV